MLKELQNYEPYTLASIGPIIYAIYWKYMESTGKRAMNWFSMRIFQGVLLFTILIYRLLNPLRNDDTKIKLSDCAVPISVWTLWIVLFSSLIYGSLSPSVILDILVIDSLDSNTFLAVHMMLIYFISLLAIITIDSGVNNIK